MDGDGGRRYFNRPGPSSSSDGGSDNRQKKVCFYWRQGKCTKFPCPYLHSELPAASNGKRAAHQGFGTDDKYRTSGGLRRSGNNNYFNNYSNTWGREQSRQPATGDRTTVKKIEKLCNNWKAQGSCRYGDACKYLHQWSTGDCFSLLTPLEGHQEVVTGIALPSGSDKLYTGSQDETVRVWDCQSGQLAGVVNLGGAVGCMLSEGPWVFVGLTNLVKAWNTQTSAELSLNGPVGQVYSLVVGYEFLFAGTQDGAILAWKFNVATNCFEPAASLKDHIRAVVLLGLLTLCGMHDSEGKPVLMCSCNDNSIRVYDLPSFSERGRIYSQKEVRSIQIGPGDLFFVGDGSGLVRVWKCSTEPAAAS